MTRWNYGIYRVTKKNPKGEYLGGGSIYKLEKIHAEDDARRSRKGTKIQVRSFGKVLYECINKDGIVKVTKEAM